jgi:hypothetical protein
MLARRNKMSVVIIGGNECMVCQYEEICKKFGCKAKVFVKEKSGFKKKIGTPDLMILFTNTVSHKMVQSAVAEARRNNTRIARTHSSSASALSQVLQTALAEC